MCKQRRAGTYLRQKNNQMVMMIGDSIMEASRSYLSTVKDDTKHRTSCTTAITIAHRAQHNTTGYSSCKFDIETTENVHS